MNSLLSCRLRPTRHHAPIAQTAWLQQVRRVVATTAFVATLLAVPQFSAAEQWTNLNGTASIDAKFLGLWNDSVVLLKSDGKRLVIGMDKLNAESRLQAEALAEKREELRQRRLAELEQSGSELTSATTSPAAPYQGVASPGSDLQTSLLQLSRQSDAGHVLRGLWDSLPASYQRDLDELVKAYAGKLDEDDLAGAQRLINQFARMLAKQKSYVFGYPRLGAMADPKTIGQIREAYDPVVGILAELGDQKLLSVESLKSRPLSEIIETKDESLAPHIARLNELAIKAQGEAAGPINMTPVQALAELTPNDFQMDGSDRGTVSIPGPGGQRQATTFVRVEGRWIPEEMANGWSEWMTQARANLDSMQTLEFDTQPIALVVGPVLSNLEFAASQEEFNAIIDQILDNVVGQFMPAGPMNGGQMAGGGAPAGPGPAANNGQGQPGAPRGRGPIGVSAGGTAGGHSAPGGQSATRSAPPAQRSAIGAAPPRQRQALPPYPRQWGHHGCPARD